DAAGNPHLRAQLMTHIGGIHQTGKNYPEALENYRQALLIMEELGISADQAVILANMGEIYREKKAYTQAAEFFRNSISIKNKLRETASGQDRIDYLASEIKTYHRLVWTLVLEGKPEEGLETAEVSQAKYLTEQLGKGFTGDDSGALEEFRSGLKDNQIYIRHLYSSLPEHLILWADNQGTGAKQLDYHLLQKSVEPELLKRNLKSYERSRGITVEAAPDTDGDTGNMENIDDLIRYYYYLLLDPEENDERYKIGRLLYDYLMAPLDDKLEGKNEIIFALDGLLHFIPLETLITPDGKYVAESFTLSYISSVQAAVMIEKRKKGETGNGILVMGGPDYSAPSVSSVYTELGYTEWPRLPGTLQEAEAIAGLYPGSTLYTGGEITEPRIKEMSGNGELASYRVIHLAAHGLVLTDNPALSALVLSQGRKYSRDEDESDGYLSMAELSDLKIAADFVNLSACETGLGRLYGGEGIVGLTQAVIIAGADSTAASLWQVADESTARFMTGMYRIVQESGVGYKAALARMKRGFIQSDDYRHPFFWAPFVFYGK
ncbi:MAG: CHAT domain-containing protein, partial [Spirochaetia bacterium]